MNLVLLLFLGEWVVSTISAILLKNSTFEGVFFILSLARNTEFEFLYIVGHNKNKHERDFVL